MRPTEPVRRVHEELLVHIEHLRQAAREVPHPGVDAARSARIADVVHHLDVLTGADLTGALSLDRNPS